jgi:hypothetical protein
MTLLLLILSFEDWGSMFLWNVSNDLQDHTALQPNVCLVLACNCFPAVVKHMNNWIINIVVVMTWQ